MEQLGQFIIIKPLASGGMADVFLAKKCGDVSNQSYVIKRVSADAGDKWYYSKLFLREAKLSVSFHHPNLVRTFEVGTHADNLYLVQEYIDGVNLRDVLKVVQRDDLIFPVTMAYYILAEVALGLSYLHGELSVVREDQICVHRDISPHNIMVSRTGDVKIIDFGITKSRDSESLTKVGSVRGKYAYMSPEQARGENVTPASDVFSLGIIFYEMLSGKRFFGESSEVELIRTLDGWSTKDIEMRLLNVGGEDGEILRLMLSSDPTKRTSALRIKSIIETRLKALDSNYGKETFAEVLTEFISEKPLPTSLGTESRVVLGERPSFQASHAPSMPSHITLYDVLTEKKKSSSYAIPLSLLIAALSVTGWYYHKNPKAFAEIQRNLASVPVESPGPRVYSKSILLKFNNFKYKDLVRVTVNGQRINDLTIQNGFKVYDGDVLVIQSYSEKKRSWSENRVIIDTSKPPALSFDL